MLPSLKWQSSFSIIPVLLLLFLGCKNNKVEERKLAGTYESKEYSKLEIAWGQSIVNTRYVHGSTINLTADSTFHYQTCGNIITGSWAVKSDSLLLYVKSNRWRNDSLHTHTFNGKQPEIPVEPFIFEIDDNLLRNENTYTETGRDKTYNVVEELIKVNSRGNY